MQKSKVFSKKLMALALAVVMAVSTFFGVVSTAYAYQNGNYHDSANTLGANALAWAETTDDAALEAALDQLDDLLGNMDWDSLQKSVDALGIESKLPSQVVSILGLSLTISLPAVQVKTTNIVTLNLNLNVSSVDGIIDTFFQIKSAFADLKGASNLASMIGYDLSGILNGIKFDTFGDYFHDSASNSTEQGYRTNNGSWRDRNSAKFIIRGLIRWLVKDNESLITNLLNGDLVLIADLLDIYKILAGPLGIDYDVWKYQQGNNGFVYNVLKAVLVNNLDYYKVSDTADHLKEESSWKYDSELFKIANYYLQKISFEITYPEYATFTPADEVPEKDDDGNVVVDPNGNVVYREGRYNDSSKRRYKQAVLAGEFDTSTGKINSSYATAQGWDPNLVYSQEEGYEGNVLVAKYASDTVAVTSSDTVYTVIWKALPIIWKSALKPTIELLHVNYDGNDLGSGTNFDNHFFYWVNEEYQNGSYTWVRGANFRNNYTDTIINAWAAAVYQDYNFASANEFLAYVKKTLTFNKTRLAKNDKYNWRDIDASILFAEIRYSPLAEHFGIQTGPLNLYWEQTGAPAIIGFFDNLYTNKTSAGFPGSLMSQLDDALVTAMGDLFPSSNKIGKAVATDGVYSGVESTSLPALSTTSSTTVASVVSTLIGDAATVFKYAADATDLNILNPFYCSEFADDGEDTIITEANIEQAIIPFAISALKHWNITASIHNADWDKVCDLESAAVVSLQEYLKYVYPDRDYTDLFELSEPMELAPGVSYKFIVASDGTTLLEHAIMPMAADALTFVLTAAGMPFFEQTANGACSSSGNVIKPLEYTFKNKGDGLNNLFWKTLNATVCYFGVDKKIAALANAPSAISYSNTIWQNANNAVNTLLPALNRLLGGSTGALDLQDLLWNKIVLSVADFGTNQGFTKILTIIGNLLTADILNNVTVFNAVIFEIAKPLINLILGARSGTADIIRVTASTTNPLDTFLVKANIVTSVNNLLSNLMGVTNGTNRDASANSTLATASANSIHAAAFILMATQALPKLRDNTVGGVSATLADHVVSAANFKTRLAIRNESWGVNDFYNDASNVTQEAGRYYATLKSIKIYNVSTGTDVTSSFTLSPNAKNSSYTMPQGTNYVQLDPEGFTRIDIQGSNVPVAVYRVEVTYDMVRKDKLSNAANNATYNNVKAVDFFSASNSSTGDVAWTDAFSGDYATNTEDARNAGLVTKATSGSLDVYGPTLIVAGSNAGSCKYGYNVENRQNSYDSDGNSTGYTGTNANLQYATVAAGTTGYTLKSGSASSAANTGAAWVAVDLEGNAIKGDGSKVTVASALASDGIGYIKDADNNYIALAVATGKIGTTASTYRAGTPVAGVYLDTTQIFVEGRHDKNNQNGSKGNRIIASDSESGLKPGYNKMVIKTTVGSFTLTIATGDIDSNYASLKDTAAGLAAHYFTSATTVTAVTSLIIPAMTKTLASGVNLDNLANSLDVEAEVKSLREAAYANPTRELQDVVSGVIKARRERSNVNYVLVANYEEGVKKAKEVEDLISLEYQWEMNGDEYVTDADGNWVPIYESGANIIPERYQAFNSLSYSPCIVLQEGARVFATLYHPQAQLRTTGVFDLLYDEITHATSSTDEYDVLGENEAGEEFTNTYESFIFEENPETIGEYHQFPYSTKDEGEWDGVKSYVVGCDEEFMPVKFGTMITDEDSGEIRLSNLRYDETADDYVKAYTDESWDAYVNALGECLEIASYMDGDDAKNVHNAYQARSHLVICENNLEIYDDEEEPDIPPISDTITVSGTVVMATDYAASTGTAGAPTISIFTDLGEAAVGTTAADGTFSVDVPVGTTSLIFSNFTYTNGSPDAGSGNTIVRTVTLNGDADVSGVTIPIIVCDYNGDKNVNAADKVVFNKAMNARTGTAKYNVFANFNGDSIINAADQVVFNKFLNKVKTNYRYADLALD